MRVAAQPDRASRNDDGIDAAQRITRRFGFIDVKKEKE